MFSHVVFCHVLKSFLYNYFSSSTSAAAGVSGELVVIQPHPLKTQPSFQSLIARLEARLFVPLVKATKPPKRSGRGG